MLAICKISLQLMTAYSMVLYIVQVTRNVCVSYCKIYTPYKKAVSVSVDNKSATGRRLPKE